MLTSVRRGAVIVVLLMGGVACGDDSVAPLAACDGPVTLQATSGTIPILRWSPACLAGRLLVEPLPPSQGFGWHWNLAADEQLIAPGVRYGVAPEGTSEEHPAWPLEPEQSYTVVLLDAEGTEIGRGEFMP